MKKKLPAKKSSKRKVEKNYLYPRRNIIYLLISVFALFLVLSAAVTKQQLVQRAQALPTIAPTPAGGITPTFVCMGLGGCVSPTVTNVPPTTIPTIPVVIVVTNTPTPSLTPKPEPTQAAPAFQIPTNKNGKNINGMVHKYTNMISNFFKKIFKFLPIFGVQQQLPANGGNQLPINGEAGQGAGGGGQAGGGGAGGNQAGGQGGGAVLTPGAELTPAEGAPAAEVATPAAKQGKGAQKKAGTLTNFLQMFMQLFGGGNQTAPTPQTGAPTAAPTQPTI